MSDCGVCLTTDDGGCDTEFLLMKIRCARKEHVCCECDQAIPKGTQYEYAWGKTDGELWRCHTCLPCAEIANAFYCGGRMFGGLLWDNMDEVFEEMNTACLDRLQTAAAKAFLLARWREWKFR
jgi:hypothetical protein